MTSWKMLLILMLNFLDLGQSQKNRIPDQVFCYTADQPFNDLCIGCQEMGIGQRKLWQALVGEKRRERLGWAKLHAIKYKGKYLFGWWFVNVIYTRRQGVWGLPDPTEAFQAIGETSDIGAANTFRTPIQYAHHGQFVYHLPDQNSPCKGPKEGFTQLWHSKNWDPVCASVTDPAIELARGFFYTNNGGIQPDSYCGFYRMNFPPCPLFGHQGMNTHFFFRGIARTRWEKWLNYTSRSAAYDAVKYQTWAYGAADPRPPRNAALTYDALKSPPDAQMPWIKETKIEDYYPNSNIYNKYEPDLCAVGKQSAFVGRCSARDAPGQYKPVAKFSSRNKHYCVSTKPWHNFTSVTEFYNQTQTCDDSCKEWAQYFENQGAPLYVGIGRFVWGFRQAHGVVMVVGALFVIPLTNFLARYYKETFLASRLIHVHAWFFVHAIGGIFGSGLVYIGFGIGIFARTFLGFSWSWGAFIHAILGYIAFVALTINLVINSFRLYKPRLRVITITVHAMTGYVLYGISLCLLLTSVFMRGSPTSLQSSCGKASDCVLKYTSLYGYSTIALFVIKVVLDCAFNHIAMVEMKAVDAAENKRREYAMIVPIPLVDGTATASRSGNEKREVLLKSYLVLNFSVVILLCILITVRNPENNFSGPSSTTHTTDGKLKPNLQNVGEEM